MIIEGYVSAQVPWWPVVDDVGGRLAALVANGNGTVFSDLYLVVMIAVEWSNIITGGRRPTDRSKLLAVAGSPAGRGDWSLLVAGVAGGHLFIKEVVINRR